MATVATHLGPPPQAPPHLCRRRRASFPDGARRSAAAACGRIRSLHNLSCLVSGTAKASVSGAEPSSGGQDASGIIDAVEVESTTPGASFLAKVAIAISIAATVTVISLLMKQPSSGPSFSLPQIVDASSQSDAAAATIGYTFSAFGKKVIIPECTPGWVYFLLLLAAGFGLFISEEALNVWAGISLARSLSLDGTWQSLVTSFSANAPYVVSTVLWIYWGVCISDMIPFYLGKLFRQSKASEGISSKIGIGKDTALSISRAVQKHGNLIGFGYTSRLLLRRSLFRLSVYSSYSVSSWVFPPRTACHRSSKRRSCFGHLDGGPLRSRGMHGALFLSPPARVQQLRLRAR